MLLSDVFKNFTKKEPAKVKKDSPSLTEKLRRGREAALELLPILKTKLAASDGRLHAGTMLSAAAWLTGTSLYRSFNFKEEYRPGTMIKSDEVNKEWESLIYLLEQYNFQKADIPVGRVVLAAMAAPGFFKPEVEMLHVQSELQGQYNAVMKKYGFDYLDGARVGIILCSILIQQYSGARIIDPDAAAGIVAQGIFEAANAVPPPL
ncbi:MAG: hypothetical protein ACXW4Q_05955 [Anaerolineales bacterium]